MNVVLALKTVLYVLAMIVLGFVLIFMFTAIAGRESEAEILSMFFFLALMIAGSAGILGLVISVRSSSKAKPPGT